MSYLEDLKALCDGAEKGPWQADEESWAEINDVSVWDATGKNIICDMTEVISDLEPNPQSHRTALFIAESRTAMPWLINQLEKHKAALEALRDWNPKIQHKKMAHDLLSELERGPE